MLDFFFYDFEFQREVPQEGITNPAGNKWVRVDKPGDEHPSPKKPRFGEHPSREVMVLVDLVTQVFTLEVLLWAHQRKMHSFKNLRIAYLSQLKRTSEDRGLTFGHLISPGCESLQFGSFQVGETRSIWSFQLNDNMAAVINEYGTNMFKSKFDPLAAIEAKSAICSGKKQGVNLDTITEESDFKEESLKELDKVMLNVEDGETNRAVSMSPEKRDTGTPMMD
jgi:hypothetical protein